IELDQRLQLIDERIQKSQNHVKQLVVGRDALSVPTPVQLAAAATNLELSAQALDFARATAARSAAEANSMRAAVEKARTALSRIEDLESCPVCGSTDDLAAARDRLRGDVEELADTAVSRQKVAEQH